MDYRYRLPQPRWRDIGAAAKDFHQRHPEIDALRLHREIGLFWLDELQDALGEEYKRFNSPSLILLTPNTHGRWLAANAVSIIKKLSRLLEPIEPNWVEPIIVIEFGNMERFYDYLGGLPGSDEGGSPAAAFLPSGYPHIVIGAMPQWSLLQILGHELAHAYTHGFEFPLWLAEGLAQYVEGLVVGHRASPADRESISEWRSFWRSGDIQRFWSGESFVGPAQEVKCSYELALVVFEKLVSAHRAAMPHFVAAASWKDGGRAAAIETLGESLSIYATSAIGMNVSDPNPESWESCVRDPDAAEE